MSCGLSPPTGWAAYKPFTPSNSEQRLLPPYYRGRHGVSRSFLCRYRQIPVLFTPDLSSLLTAVYDLTAFIPHAALHHQGFPHCG